jgi:hypothetical protein
MIYDKLRTMCVCGASGNAPPNRIHCPALFELFDLFDRTTMGVSTWQYSTGIMFTIPSVGGTSFLARAFLNHIKTLSPSLSY